MSLQSTTPIVGSATAQLLEAAILEACDDLDGLADGILGDPRECDFRLEDLPRCSAADSVLWPRRMRSDS